MSSGSRIAYLCHEYPKYSETFVYREIDSLRELGADVVVFAMKKPTNVGSIENADAKIASAVYLAPDFGVTFILAQLYWLLASPIKYLSLIRMMIFGEGTSSEAPLKIRLGFVMRGALAALEMMKRDVKVLHCPATGDELIAAHAASVLSKIPLGFTLHAPLALFVESRLLGVHARSATFVAAISKDAQDRIITLAGDEIASRVKVVHCGIDLPPKTPQSNSTAPMIASVGSLWSVKGHDVLIEAVSILRRRGINATCEIIGEGPERAKLESLIDKLDLKGVVTLRGAKPPEFVRETIANSRCFALACRVNELKDRDGIPVALMEAMAGERPCVSTKVSGIPELIADGETGFLVEQDDPKALADALEKLIASPELCRQMGEKSRERIASRFALIIQARMLKSEFEGISRTILYLSHEFPKTTETFVLREINALQKLGLKIKVISFKKPPFSPKNKVTHLNSKSPLTDIAYLSDSGISDAAGALGIILKNPLTSARLFLKAALAGTDKTAWRPGLGAVADVLRGALIASKIGPNVRGIHASFATVTANAAWAASEYFRISFGFTSHSSPKDALIRDKCLKSKWIFSESEFDRDYLMKLAGNEIADKIRVIRCGLNPDDWPESLLNSDRYATGPALFVGSIGPKKGVIPLAKAITKLHRQGVDIRLNIVGDGPLHGEMLSIFRDAQVSDNVTFLGEMPFDDLKKLYSTARFLVLPSLVTDRGDRDGIPVTLIEAMASFLPCISTKVSGIPELIDDGVTGILVEQNDVDALANAMENLWRDPKLCAEMGEAGRKKAFQNHDLRVESKKMLEAFQALGLIDDSAN